MVSNRDRFLLFKIFEWNKQHSKTLSATFAYIFMVHFVRPSYCFCIFTFGVSKNFEPLVNKNIVNQKVSQTISKNSNAQSQTNTQYFIFPKHKKTNTNYCINYKKSIIAFKPRIMVFFMMVFVKIPHKTMHYVFVTKPSHKFHKQKCYYEN